MPMAIGRLELFYQLGFTPDVDSMALHRVTSSHRGTSLTQITAVIAYSRPPSSVPSGSHHSVSLKHCQGIQPVVC